MINKTNAFHIQDCRLIHLKMDANKAAAPKKKAKVCIDISIEHSYQDTDDSLTLILGVDVGGKDFFLNLSVKYEGIFKFHKKPKTEEQLTKIAEINCSAILFPFVREIIAELTRKAGFSPLVLDPINFVEYYNINHIIEKPTSPG